APVNITADHGNRLLMGLAERADVIVDFTNVPLGNSVLANVGAGEPFGRGVGGAFGRWGPGRGLRGRRPWLDRADHGVPCRPGARDRRFDPAAVSPVARNHAAAARNGDAAAANDL